MNSTSQTAFLLGAGFSIPVGMPSTQTLTNIILSGVDNSTYQPVYRHTDSTYYFGSTPIQDEEVWRVRKLLHILKGEIDRYYEKTHYATTYEDLYYLTAQIHDSKYGQVDNPAIQSLIDKLRPVIQLLLIPESGERRQEWSLCELVTETMNYIRDIVWRRLISVPQSELTSLSLLSEAIQDERFSIASIFTLNHDTVIEECLRASNIEYVDGFGDAINDVRYFSSEVYSVDDNRVKVFKLHGSLNWFRYDAGIGIPTYWDYQHTYDPQGNLQWPQGAHPAMLLGRFNKMLDYTEGTFFELQFQLYSRLKKLDNLIVCGYSFNDQAINTRIVEWIFSSQRPRILIIDPGGEQVKYHARGAISKNWDKWFKPQRLGIIAKGIENTSWSEIAEWLSKGS